MSFGLTCQTCGCIESSCNPCRIPSVCSNCASCCCTSTHVAWRRGRIIDGLKLEYFTTAWMGVEVAGSLAAGLIASSFALIAFGSDSVIELISALAVTVHLRKDYEGSQLLGTRTATLTSLLLISLVPTIGLASTYSYFIARVSPEASLLGLVVATGAVIIMPILWLQKRKIGREANCLPLSIDALQSATCFLMSVALLSGLLMEYLFRLGWADYVATLVILGFVAREAAESYHETRS